MALKFTFNPLSGKFDALQDLSEYAKLATEITVTDLIAKKNAGELTVNAWYKVTGFISEGLIAGTTTEIYAGSEEIFLVRALATDKLETDCYSLTYENESFVMDWEPPSLLDYTYGEFNNSDWWAYYDNFTISEGGLPVTINNATSATFGWSDINKADYTADPDSLTFYIYDNDSEVEIELGDWNYGDDWEWDNTTGKLTILDGSSGYITDGFDFTNNVYLEGYFSSFWMFNYGDYNFDIISSDKITLTDPTDIANFNNRYLPDFYLYFYDPVLGEEVYLTNENYNDDWEWDGLGTITILDGSSQYISDGFEFGNLFLDYSFSELNIPVIVKVYNGQIVNRKNHVQNLDIDGDYRSILVRRWKPQFTTYNSGTTYNKGDVVKSGSSLYFCALDGVVGVSPTAAITSWGRISGPVNVEHVLVNSSNMTVGVNCTIRPDLAEYKDVPMFARVDRLFQIKIKNPNSFGTTLNFNMLTEGFSKNIDITVAGQLQILGNVNNLTEIYFTQSNIIGAINDVKGIQCSVSILDSSSFYTFSQLGNSFIRSMTNDFNRINQCALLGNNNQRIVVGTLFIVTIRGSITDSRLYRIQQATFDSTIVSSIIASLARGSFAESFSENLLLGAATDINASTIFNQNFVVGTMTAITTTSVAPFSNNSIFNTFSFTGKGAIQKAVQGNVLFGVVSGNTFNEAFSLNVCYGNFQNNTINIGSFSDNVFFAAVINNTFNASLSRNFFYAGVSFNNFTGTSTVWIRDSVFKGTVSYNTLGNSNFRIERSEFNSFGFNTFSGTFRIYDSFIGGTFLNNNISSAFTIEGVKVFGNFNLNTGTHLSSFTRGFIGGDFISNQFITANSTLSDINSLGAMTSNTFNGCTMSSMSFLGISNGNSYTGTISDGTRHNNYTGKTETSNSNHNILADIGSTSDIKGSLTIGTRTGTGLNTASFDADGKLIEIEGLAGVQIQVVDTTVYNEETDYHLDIGVNKIVLNELSIETTSTNWDFYILQNGNGYAVDDAVVGKRKIVASGNGNLQMIGLGVEYQDEDAEKELHFYFRDNAGTATITKLTVAGATRI
jgi:hypothetical protein